MMGLSKRFKRLLLLFTIVISMFSGTDAQQALRGPELTFRVVSEYSGIPSGEKGRLALIVTIPDGWHINAHKPKEEYLIPTTFSILPQEGFTVGSYYYPEPHEFSLKDTEVPLLVYSGEFAIGFELTVASDVTEGEHILRGQFHYQACDDAQCWMPMTKEIEVPVRVLPKGIIPEKQATNLFDSLFQNIQKEPQENVLSVAQEESTFIGWDHTRWEALATQFEVTGRNSGYMNSRVFLRWLRDVELGVASAELNRFASMGLWLIAVLTLVGGVALNLTPCVLPLIPVNLAIIGAGAKSPQKLRGFILGAAYGLAMAIVYGILGVIAATLGIAFGTLNASPWFNFTIAGIFVVLSLAMFDFFEIDLSKYRAKISTSRKEGGSVLIAFFMGAVAALLAGACVGPVVISVILFAQDLYAKGSYLGLALPFLLGLGMGLPWPLIGAGISLFPKPGAWMVRVRQVLGGVILLLAMYYGVEGAKLLRDSMGVAEEKVSQSVQSTIDEGGWYSDLLDALELARKSGKPVFIDFWATWCKNCLTMDQTTFKNPEVLRELNRYVKVKFQAQYLDRSPTKEVMERFGVGGLGLPVYVILSPRGSSGLGVKN